MNNPAKIRRALFAGFLIIGFVMASWIVRTPSIRDVLQASTFQMGLILFGFSLGSMIGILLAGRFTRQFGSDKGILVGLVVALSGLLTLAVAIVLVSPLLTAIGLGLVGFGMALSEVAVNILGARVEHALGKPVLTAIHGCFSLGTVIGAVCGLMILSAGLVVELHMLIVCGLLAPALVYVVIGVWGAHGNSQQSDDSRQTGFFATMASDPKLLAIGIIVLAMALAEGTANDWLPLLIVDSHGVSEKLGSLVFIGFAITMTIGRFLGSSVLDHYGAATVIRSSAIIGALGILLVVVSPNIWVAGIAVVLWGLGTSLGFPVAMSAGASDGENASARVSALATIGYTAFLVGPPMLGFIGEHIGLRLTMLVVLALLILPIFAASALKKAR